MLGELGRRLTRLKGVHSEGLCDSRIQKKEPRNDRGSTTFIRGMKILQPVTEMAQPTDEE